MSEMTTGIGPIQVEDQKKIKGSGKGLTALYDTNPISWVGSYIPPFFEPEYGHNFPYFRRSLINTIRMDPRIRYGLNIIKGPIQAYTAFFPEKEAENPILHETIREEGIQFAYGIRCDDKECQQFILDTINKIWQCGLQEILLAIDWGFSCCQIIYKEKIHRGKKRIVYDSLQHINPFNTGPIVNKTRQMVGARIRGVAGGVGGKDIPLYKIIWHVHSKEHHRFWGQSRLEWAFVPWHETWVQYGARDIRRTWFHRNSYDGGSMRYPIGRTKLDSGEIVENRDLAVQMMTQIKTGGVRVFANELLGDQRTPAWDYEAPSANATPSGLMEYPEMLRLEILEALGIPPEVVEGGGGGLGSATGRKVPLMVYYSSLSPLVNNAINDIRRFIIDILLLTNFKKEIEYDIYPIVPLKSQEPVQPEGVGGTEKTDQIENTEEDTGL